jgi:hypothetical protein
MHWQEMNFHGQITEIQNPNLKVVNIFGLQMNAFAPIQVKVKVTLRLTVSQSVCLGVEPRLGLMTRYLRLF